MNKIKYCFRKNKKYLRRYINKLDKNEYIKMYYNRIGDINVSVTTLLKKGRYSYNRRKEIIKHSNGSIIVMYPTRIMFRD